MKKTVAITGANGFVGSALCRELSKRFHVIRLSRKCGDIAFSLNKVNALPAVPIDIVVHCAHSFSRTHGAFRENIKGTKDIYRWAVKNGATQFIFISSLAASQRTPSLYGRTKWKIERWLAKQSHTTILRLGTVVGHGGIFAKAFRLFSYLPIIPLAFPHSQIRFLAPNDIASAIHFVIDNRLIDTFFVGRPEVSLEDFLLALRKFSGRRVRFVRIPAGIVFLFFRILEVFHVRLMIGTDNLNGLAHTASPSINRNSRELKCLKPLSLDSFLHDALST